MFLTDTLAMKGRLHLQLTNKAGHLVTTTAADNAIVFTGRELVAQLFVQVKNTSPISHIAVGIGSQDTDPAGDTALNQEVFRKALKPFDRTKDLTSLTVEVPTQDGSQQQKSSRVRLSADLDFNEPNPDDRNGKTYELTEAGLFNAADGGIMYNRVVFPKISKTADFKLTLVWEIIF